jgi:hypothetical protein
VELEKGECTSLCLQISALLIPISDLLLELEWLVFDEQQSKGIYFYTSQVQNEGYRQAPGISERFVLSGCAFSAKVERVGDFLDP